MFEETKSETATLGAGCFWCIEAVLQQVPGVISMTSGYMGGHVKDPTYYQICEGNTGHAEVVQVKFDPSALTFSQLLENFWKLHDPTTMDRQGNDVGSQYRSVIYYHSDEQRDVALKSIEENQKYFSDPIVTHVLPATQYYQAEEEHQNYYQRNKQEGYCWYVIQPKLRKLGFKL